MISNPKVGWCNFELGDFKGTPSYLTDVPMDLLNAFIDYYTRGNGIAEFDEEGSEFTLVLTRNGVYIIEAKDAYTLHAYHDIDISDLAQKLMIDIVFNIDGWCNGFMLLCDKKKYRHELNKRISKLNGLISQ